MVSTLWSGGRRRRVLEDVRTEARTLDPARVALTLIAIPFFLVGWIVAKVFASAWTAGTWAWTAAQVGWRAARKELE